MVEESKNSGSLPDSELFFKTVTALLGQAARHLGEGMLIQDLAGGLTFLNEKGERILGWQQQALLGASVHDRIHHQVPAGEPIPTANCPVLQYIHRGETHRTEQDVFVHHDGHLVPVATTTSPLITENGAITGAITVFQELGKHKEIAQEIKQASDILLETARLKSEFLANMSHEIRTPINGVIGMTDLLLGTKLNKEQKYLAKTARESAQALLTIVNDILDFSRLEAGKLGIEAVKFSPLKVVEEVSGLLGSQAQKKGIDIFTDVSAKIPLFLQGDPARLRQVLLILVGNGIKFTKKGEVVVRARLEERSNTRIIIRFSVIDTGIGIPKSARHRLFLPFTQVDGSSKRPFGGTGLGLSIASRLVELMGGEIGFQNKKGKGSIFWFSIPLSRCHDPAEEQPLPPPTQLKGVKVLVVDPQLTGQTILLNHLLGWQMKGTAVENPQEALTFLRHETQTPQPCSLVLVSSAIPMVEAMPLARTISQDPQLAPISLVLLTGIEDKKSLEEARRAGFVTHIPKPLQREQLLKCLLTLHNPHFFSDSPPETALPPPTHSPGHPEGGQPILLAESNSVMQKVSQTQLSRLGYAVHTVPNGAEAVQSAQNASYCLILMDCRMPVMDGFMATQTIRASEKAGKHPPIIGMSARSMESDREQCLASGMDDMLAKPLQMDRLAAMLKKWLPLPQNRITTPSRPPVTDDPPSPTNPTQPPPDKSGGGDNGPEKTGKTFLETTTNRLAMMAVDLEKKNGSSLAERAQKLYLESTRMGEMGFSALSRRLEAYALVRNWGQCRTFLEKIVAELEQRKNPSPTTVASN